MICALCLQPIAQGDAVNLHHPIYKSNGGIETEPTHRACHVAFHSMAGDFRSWGRLGGQLSALSKQWSFNLKHVRSHPAHEINRAFYSMNYARATQ